MEMPMSRLFLSRLALPLVAVIALLPAAGTLAATAAEHPAVKRKFSLPPSAELSYSIKATQSGITLGGKSLVNWQAADGKYTLTAETRAELFGKILESKSEGAIDDFGLAPLQFTEKRVRQTASTTLFKRDSKTIVFSESAASYPLLGGEQDRSSVQWQLVAVARAAPEKFVAGTEWTFFVAGRRDAEPWTFKVIKQETIRTPLGELKTLHLSKAPPPDSKEQKVDLWLAPAHEWYPVRLRFTDGEYEYIEQTLVKITPK
jgi:hypothetical protein